MMKRVCLRLIYRLQIGLAACKFKVAMAGNSIRARARWRFASSKYTKRQM